MKKLRVALVHEWLDEFAGSELVLSHLLQIFPDADVFSLVDFMQEPDRDFLRGKRVRTSFLQKLPFARKHFRAFLPLMPLAVEAMDVSEYDLVISNSHAVVKGILMGPDQVHISYCHTPIRYGWDLQHQYLRRAGVTGLRWFLALIVLHYLRLWDRRTVAGIDVLLGNSNYIARRIRRVYGRTAEVLYPPVRLNRFTLKKDKESFYLAVCRNTPYKRVDVILDAFAKMPTRRLIFVNSGGAAEIPDRAAAKNITILGRLAEQDLIDLMQRARAFVFAAEEDFGITVVEAQACGTPVICYGKGGAVETVIDGETGVHFMEQTAASLVGAIERFEEIEHSFSPSRTRANAERFSVQAFEQNVHAIVDRALSGSVHAATPQSRIVKASGHTAA